MNKTEYMKVLAHKLRRLPKEDYDKAIEYFEEYFAEAGPEYELQAIQDLGTPEEAAAQLIMDLAEKNVKERPKTVKRGFSSVWIGVLGICAAPIALPVALALIAVIFSLVIVVLALILSLFVTALALIACGFLGVIGGTVFLFGSGTFADGLTTLGFSLSCFGIGGLFTYGSVVFCKWFLSRISTSLGKITKGGRKNGGQIHEK